MRKTPRHGKNKRISSPLAALLTIGLAVGFVTTAQGAAPVLSTASSASYTENGSPVDVLSNLSVTGGPFDGGYIEISIQSGTSAETLSVPQVGTLGEISTTSGEITVYDDKLYLGEGGSYTQIGQISATQTGVGKPLRFEFISSFENAGFEGIANNTFIDSNPIAGWTAKTDALIKPGTTTLNFGGTNYTIPDTWKKVNYACSGNSALLASNSTLSTLETYVTNGDKNEGTNSLRLRSQGTISEGGRVAFGPLVFSDEFTAESGQTLFFDWRANAGGDNYHVLSYLVKIDGSPSVSDWTEILDQYGNSSSASTSWATQSVNIPSTGTYRFVFISGTQDYTCKQGVGASLYIDNVQVVGSKADATAVQTLTRKVQYSSTDDNPSATRTLDVEAESGDSNTDTFSGASTISITAVDDAPAIQDETVTVNATNTSTDPVTVTGTLTLSDPDSTETVSIDSGTAESGTVSTVSYDQKIETAEGTFFLDSSNGEYAFQAPLSDFIGNTDSRSTSFGVTATGDGVTDTATVTVNLAPTGAPGKVTNIQSAIFGSNIGLTWTSPTFFGGSTITGYKIEKLVGGSYQTVVADTGSTATSWDSGSGAAAQDTTFRISAINSSGAGATQTYVQPASYTITYSAGSGGSNAPSNVTVLPAGTFDTDDSTGLSNSDASRTFVHWSDGTNTYAASETVTPTSDLTLTAIWTSKITYDSNVGTGTVAPEYGYTDYELDDGSALERSGFNLIEWNTKADGTGTAYDLGATQTVTSDLTLYAIWSVPNGPLVLEDPIVQRVWLGDLATRSQWKDLEKSGATAPYTMTGVDSLTGEVYTYQTDQNYTGAQLQESTERLPRVPGQTKYEDFSATLTGTGLDAEVKLVNDGILVTGNTNSDGTVSYGSMFGPEIYTEPFVADPRKAISFQWKATGADDDYEIYAYLVKINDQGNCSASTDYGLQDPLETHTVVAYGRGDSADWTIASGNVPDTGCYRFRFVHGTYDATGGDWVGATFYVKNVQLADAQVISFPQPEDKILSSSAQTISLTATTNASGTVTYSTTDTNVCTISGSTLTIKANASGNCTVKADAEATGDYGPAQPVYRTLTARASAAKPVSYGGDLIGGTAITCEASSLTAVEGSWGTGGATITSTTYQWQRSSNNSTWADIAGETSASYDINDTNDAGKYLRFEITKTNSQGSTTATSNSVLVSDTRMTSIGVSSGSLSPSVSACGDSYTIAPTSTSFTITPDAVDSDATLKVNGNNVAQGANYQTTLSSGANTVELVVTENKRSRSINIVATPAVDPLISELSVDDLVATSATLKAKVDPRSSSPNVSFVWDTDNNPGVGGTSVTATPSSISAGSGLTSVEADLTGLTGATTYYFHVVAGSTTSSVFSFTTPNAPIVKTDSASAVSASDQTSISVTGTVNPNTESTVVIAQYSTNADMSGATDVSISTLTGDTDQSVSTTITGLTTGVTYYVRISGTNSVGTNTGSIKSVTLVGKPDVVTGASSSETQTSATISGTVDANLADTSRIVFEYGEQADLSDATEVKPTPDWATGSSASTVNLTLTGLKAGTKYYYRLKATNSQGTESGSIASFDTVAVTPPEITYSSTSITATKGSAITNVTATVDTGSVDTWSIEGDLPEGLTFNTSNGTISGTPTQRTAQAKVTVYATNLGGTASQELIFKITATTSVSWPDRSGDSDFTNDAAIEFDSSSPWIDFGTVGGNTFTFSEYENDVTVTISSSSAKQFFRLQSLDSRFPGSLRAPENNLRDFDKDSLGLNSFSISGPIDEIKTALEDLELRSTGSDTATLTIEVVDGDNIVFMGSGGNNHAYQVISEDKAISFSDAFARAAASKIPSTDGNFCQGYILTITSQDEQDFVLTKFGANSMWLGAADDGGAEDQTGTEIWDNNGMSYVEAAKSLSSLAQADTGEGNFFWINGPERGQLVSEGNLSPTSNAAGVGSGSFTIDGTNVANYPWSSNEPNNFRGDEDFLHVWPARNNLWNDYKLRVNSLKTFVIEYGGVKASANHSSFDNAPFGDSSEIMSFESDLDDNLDDTDYMGTVESCVPLATETRSVDTYPLSVIENVDVSMGDLTNVSDDGSTASFTITGSVDPNGDTVDTKVFYRDADADNNGTNEAADSNSDGILDTPDGNRTYTSQSGSSSISLDKQVTGADKTEDHYYQIVVYEAGTSNVLAKTAIFTFRTPAAPTAMTSGAVVDTSTEDETSVELSGMINPWNTALTTATDSDTRFQLSTTSDFGSIVAYGTLDIPVPTGNTLSAATSTVTGLTPGVTYYYRLFAKNAQGENYGEVRSFTLQGKPEVETIQVSTTTNAVELEGTVDANMADTTEIVFEYGTDSALADASEVNPKTFTDLENFTLQQASGSDPTSFKATVSDLPLGTYYYRISATNSKGTSVGSILSFQVTVGAPEAPTPEASVSGSSATLSWTAPADNGSEIIDYEVMYSTDNSNFVIYPEGTSSATNATVSGLPNASSYYFRVAAVNSVGISPQGATAYITPSGSGPAYTGPIINRVERDNIDLRDFTAEEELNNIIYGQRLSGVTKIFVGGIEAELVSVTDNALQIIVPRGLEPGVYDIEVYTTAGNLTYLDAFTIFGATFTGASTCVDEPMSWWTTRISSSEAKVYIKCPELDRKLRILIQYGGSGEYEVPYVKTLRSSDDPSLIVNSFGTYIVRTIELEEINRVRIRIDDEEVLKVRYNNYPGTTFSPSSTNSLVALWGRITRLFG